MPYLPISPIQIPGHEAKRAEVGVSDMAMVLHQEIRRVGKPDWRQTQRRRSINQHWRGQVGATWRTVT